MPTLAVREGVSERLDRLRDDLAGLDAHLLHVAGSDRHAEGQLHGLSFEYVYAHQAGFYCMMTEGHSRHVEPGSMQFIVSA